MEFNTDHFMKKYELRWGFDYIMKQLVSIILAQNNVEFI